MHVLASVKMLTPLLEKVFLEFTDSTERALGDGGVGAWALVDISPSDLEKKVEATAGIRLVLNNSVERWLVVGSIDLPPGLSPFSLGGAALEDVQSFEALNRLPVANPRGEACQVVRSGARVR